MDVKVFDGIEGELFEPDNDQKSQTSENQKDVQQGEMTNSEIVFDQTLFVSENSQDDFGAADLNNDGGRDSSCLQFNKESTLDGHICQNSGSDQNGIGTDSENNNASISNTHETEDKKTEENKVGSFFCFGCKHSFKTFYDLCVHLYECHDSPPVYCDKCGTGFTDPLQKKAHLQEISNNFPELPFECDQCHMGFTTKDILEFHKDGHQQPKLIQCGICNLNFSSQGERFINHYNVHVSKKAINNKNDNEILNIPNLFSCHVCKITCSSPAEIFLHLKTHPGPYAYICFNCGIGYDHTSLKDKNKHKTEHEKDGNLKYVCEICHQRFVNCDLLQLHIDIHRGKSVFQCPTCKRGYKDGMQLHYHVNDPLLKCPGLKDPTYSKIFKGGISNYKKERKDTDFSQPLSCLQLSAFSNFEGEKKTLHTTLRKGSFKCGSCGEQYQQFNHLFVHLKGKHNFHKPDICGICGLGVQSLCKLQKHKLRHNTEDLLLYRCNICDMGFMNIDVLAFHCRKHTKQSLFLCDRCGKKLTLNSFLSHFIKCEVDNEEKVNNSIVCKHCPLTFHTQQMLEIHIRSNHWNSCSYCFKTFETPTEFEDHKTEHADKYLYKCGYCGKVFDDLVLFIHHMNIHIVMVTSGLFVCHICSMSFKDKCKFDLHRESHEKISCKQCGITVKMGDEMIEHLKTCSIDNETKQDNEDHDKSKKKKRIRYQKIEGGPDLIDVEGLLEKLYKSKYEKYHEKRKLKELAKKQKEFEEKQKKLVKSEHSYVSHSTNSKKRNMINTSSKKGKIYHSRTVTKRSPSKSLKAQTNNVDSRINCCLKNRDEESFQCNMDSQQVLKTNVITQMSNISKNNKRSETFDNGKNHEIMKTMPPIEVNMEANIENSSGISHDIRKLGYQNMNYSDDLNEQFRIRNVLAREEEHGVLKVDENTCLFPLGMSAYIVCEPVVDFSTKRTLRYDPIKRNGEMQFVFKAPTPEAPKAASTQNIEVVKSPESISKTIIDALKTTLDKKIKSTGTAKSCLAKQHNQVDNTEFTETVKKYKENGAQTELVEKSKQAMRFSKRKKRPLSNNKTEQKSNVTDFLPLKTRKMTNAFVEHQEGNKQKIASNSDLNQQTEFTSNDTHCKSNFTTTTEKRIFKSVSARKNMNQSLTEKTCMSNSVIKNLEINENDDEMNTTMQGESLESSTPPDNVQHLELVDGPHSETQVTKSIEGKKKRKKKKTKRIQVKNIKTNIIKRPKRITNLVAVKKSKRLEAKRVMDLKKSENQSEENDAEISIPYAENSADSSNSRELDPEKLKAFLWESAIKSKEEGIFKCRRSACNVSFKNYRHLMVHMSSNHTSRLVHVCATCGQGYTSSYVNGKKQKNNHNLKHNDMTLKEKCDELDCERLFLSKELVDFHKHTDHDGNSLFHCDICNHVISSCGQFIMHYKACLKVKYIDSVETLYKTTSDASVDTMQFNNSTSKLKEFNSEGTNGTQSSDDQHQFNHDQQNVSQRDLQCNPLENRVTDNVSLSTPNLLRLFSTLDLKSFGVDITTVSQSEKIGIFTCENCGDKFDSSAKLYLHLYYHPYPHIGVCFSCGYGISANTYFFYRWKKDHKWKHEKEQLPYACLLCSETFKLQELLELHEKKHKGYQLLHCDKCLRGFDKPEYYIPHIKKNTCTIKKTPKISSKGETTLVKQPIKHQDTNLIKKDIYNGVKNDKSTTIEECISEKTNKKMETNKTEAVVSEREIQCDINTAKLLVSEGDENVESVSITSITDVTGQNDKENEARISENESQNSSNTMSIINNHSSIPETATASKQKKFRILQEKLRDARNQQKIVVDGIHCKVCNKFLLIDKSYMCQHGMAYKYPEANICEKCGKIFSRKYNLKIHTIRQHTEKTHICPVCYSSFALYKELEKHIKSYSCIKKMKQYDSITADHTYAKIEPNDNENIPDDVKYFRSACEEIDDKNNVESYLKKVKNKHVCKACGRVFRIRKVLRQHVRTVHLDIKKYVCSNCNQAFGSRSQLRHHESSVHSQETFECKICHKLLTTSRGLQLHNKKYHKESYTPNIYACNICNVNFETFTEKYRHKRQHHSNIKHQYDCPICGRSLASRRGVRQHIEKIHQKKPTKPTLKHDENSPKLKQSVFRQSPQKIDNNLRHKETEDAVSFIERLMNETPEKKSPTKSSTGSPTFNYLHTITHLSQRLFSGNLSPEKKNSSSPKDVSKYVMKTGSPPNILRKSSASTSKCDKQNFDRNDNKSVNQKEIKSERTLSLHKFDKQSLDKSLNSSVIVDNKDRPSCSRSIDSNTGSPITHKSVHKECCEQSNLQIKNRDIDISNGNQNDISKIVKKESIYQEDAHLKNKEILQKNDTSKNEEYSNVKNASIHDDEITTDEFCICDECGKMCIDKKQLTKHKHKLHSKKLLNCNFCGIVFKTKYKAELHKRQYHKNIKLMSWCFSEVSETTNEGAVDGLNLAIKRTDEPVQDLDCNPNKKRKVEEVLEIGNEKSETFQDSYDPDGMCITTDLNLSDVEGCFEDGLDIDSILDTLSNEKVRSRNGQLEVKPTYTLNDWNSHNVDRLETDTTVMDENNLWDEHCNYHDEDDDSDENHVIYTATPITEPTKHVENKIAIDDKIDNVIYTATRIGDSVEIHETNEITEIKNIECDTKSSIEVESHINALSFNSQFDITQGKHSKTRQPDATEKILKSNESFKNIPKPNIGHDNEIPTKDTFLVKEGADETSCLLYSASRDENKLIIDETLIGQNNLDKGTKATNSSNVISSARRTYIIPKIVFSKPLESNKNIIEKRNNNIKGEVVPSTSQMSLKRKNKLIKKKKEIKKIDQGKRIADSIIDGLSKTITIRENGNYKFVSKEKSAVNKNTFPVDPDSNAVIHQVIDIPSDFREPFTSVIDIPEIGTHNTIVNLPESTDTAKVKVVNVDTEDEDVYVFFGFNHL